MSEKSMLGGALAEVAGPLKDFAEKLGGDEGEQWLAAFKRFLCKEEPWFPEFPIWKTIKLGTGLKTAEDFLRVLRDGGFKVDPWASGILGKPAFIAAAEETEVDLVMATVVELGFKKQIRGCNRIYERAKEFGLKKCPAEVGPQLRLQYQDQSYGERIFVAMESIIDSNGDSLAFYLRYDSCGRQLLTYSNITDYFWGHEDKWVFVRPRK